MSMLSFFDALKSFGLEVDTLSDRICKIYELCVMNSWSLLLNEKVVFIAGGAGWIGRHIAKTCYDHGARVVVADRDIHSMENMVSSAFPVDLSDERVFLVQIDLQEKSTLEEAIKLVMRKWMTIDILVNA